LREGVPVRFDLEEGSPTDEEEPVYRSAELVSVATGGIGTSVEEVCCKMGIFPATYFH
jgi:hypothetical protein